MVLNTNYNSVSNSYFVSRASHNRAFLILEIGSKLILNSRGVDLFYKKEEEENTGELIGNNAFMHLQLTN